jgi:hypothetical protein
MDFDKVIASLVHRKYETVARYVVEQAIEEQRLLSSGSQRDALARRYSSALRRRHLSETEQHRNDTTSLKDIAADTLEKAWDDLGVPQFTNPFRFDKGE